MSRIIHVILICIFLLSSCNLSPEIQDAEPKVCIRGVVQLEDRAEHSGIKVLIPELNQEFMTDLQGSYMFEITPRSEPITV